jgi:hypothetical protein
MGKAFPTTGEIPKTKNKGGGHCRIKLKISLWTTFFSKIHEQKDKGFSARIRKAESEATEAQSWSVLAKWTDLENLEKTRAYGMIGAAVSRSPFTRDGELGLGRALWHSLEDKKEAEKSSAGARLRQTPSLPRKLRTEESLTVYSEVPPVQRL